MSALIPEEATQSSLFVCVWLAAALKAKRDHPNEAALLPDGTHYIGALNAQGRPHGNGATFYPDGSPEYSLLVDIADANNSGRWIDGKVHGRAMQLNSGAGGRYEGYFKDGLRDGRGLYSWFGNRYNGQFVAGRFCGLGGRWGIAKLIKCGRWKDDQLQTSCAVPVRVLLGPRASALQVSDRVRLCTQPSRSALNL